MGRYFYLKLALGLHHMDAHFTELRQDVLNLLGLHLRRGKQRVLVVSDVTALLGAVEQAQYGRVGKVERRALRTLFLQHLFVLWRHLDLACRETSESSPVPRLEARGARRAASSGGPRNHPRFYRQQALTL
jgi:hypothetical protein